jgi:hypothetical protein
MIFPNLKGNEEMSETQSNRFEQSGIPAPVLLMAMLQHATTNKEKVKACTDAGVKTLLAEPFDLPLAHVWFLASKMTFLDQKYQKIWGAEMVGPELEQSHVTATLDYIHSNLFALDFEWLQALNPDSLCEALTEMATKCEPLPDPDDFRLMKLKDDVVLPLAAVAMRDHRGAFGAASEAVH